MFGHTVDGHDVGKVDFGRSSRRKLNLGLFGSFLKALESHRVLTEVNAFVLDELVSEPVDDYVVEVVAAQVGVAVGGFHLKHTITELEDGDIECAATEVEHCDFLVLVALVEAVGKCGCRRLVDDTAHGETGDFAGFLGGLTLGVVEVCRHGNHSLFNLLAEIIFGGLLHLLKNHGGDFLRSVLAAVDVDARSVVVGADNFIRNTLDFFLHLVVGLAHETLDGVDRTAGVGDGLTLGGVAHLTFAAIYEGNHRRSGVAAFAIGDYNGVFTFQHCYAGVGCT